MRKFRSFEKEFIRAIVKANTEKGRVTLDKIFKEVLPKGIKIHFIYGMTEQIFYYIDSNSKIDFDNDIQIKVIEITYLIQYLMDEKYLYQEKDVLFGNRGKVEINTLNISSNDLESWLVTSPIINNVLSPLMRFNYYPSANLAELVQNDFLTEDEKNNKDNLKWLRISVYVTAIATLLSLFITFYDSYKDPDIVPTKVIKEEGIVINKLLKK